MPNDLKRIKIEQTGPVFDNPLLVRLKGGRWSLLVIALVVLSFNTCDLAHYVKESNKIKLQHLEQLRKQYALDSLRFEHMKQLR